MEKQKIIENLKKLPTPLVGSLAFQSREELNLRDSCIDMIKEIVKISNPKNILEIGTHLGHSSCLLLSLSEANVLSVDIGHTWVTWEAGFSNWGQLKKNGGLKEVVYILQFLFPGRFQFALSDSTDIRLFEIIKNNKYELIFIDGNHDYEYVKKDIGLAFKLNIPYILLDDYTLRDGDKDARIVAAKEMELIPIKIYENIHNASDIGCGFFKNPKYVET